MNKQEIEELDALEPDHFDSRELVALRWARSFLRENGKPNAAMQAQFEDTFSPEERELITATVKGAFITNLTSNAVRLWLERLSSLLKRGTG